MVIITTALRLANRKSDPALSCSHYFLVPWLAYLMSCWVFNFILRLFCYRELRAYKKHIFLFHVTNLLTNSIDCGTWRLRTAFTRGFPVPILSRINLIPRNDTCFFKMHSNIVYPYMDRHSSRSLSCRYLLIPWLMEHGGSKPHLKGLSNNPYP